jgi:voltage-gated sodium channel
MERCVELQVLQGQYQQPSPAVASSREGATGFFQRSISEEAATVWTDTQYQLIPAGNAEAEAKEHALSEIKISPVPEVEQSEFSQRGAWFLQSIGFQVVMACLIIGNSLVIGMETDIRDYKHWNEIENFFLVAFLIELLLKLGIYGPREMYRPTNLEFNWNCFDSFIVGLGVLDVVFTLIAGKSSGSAATLFRIIRLLRILRIIRIVKFLKQLYLLAFGLAEAAQAVFWVTILMTFILYVCAIIMVKTVGRPNEDDPHHDFLEYHFGAVLPSMCTLFVLMSSPNLPIYQDESGLLASRPAFAMFLVIFIIFGSFGMIALLTGVISESMFEKNDMRKEEERLSHETMRNTMQVQCKRLFGSLTLDEEDSATTKDVKALVPEMALTFETAGVFFSQFDLEKIVDYMDVDESGTIDEEEFTRGMLVLAEGVRPISIQEVHHAVGVCRIKLELMEEHFRKQQEGASQENTIKEEKAEKLEGLVKKTGLKSVDTYFEEVLSAQRQSSAEIREEVREVAALVSEALRHGTPFSSEKAPSQQVSSTPMVQLAKDRTSGQTQLASSQQLASHSQGSTGTPCTTIGSSTSAWPTAAWSQSNYPAPSMTMPSSLVSTLERQAAAAISDLPCRGISAETSWQPGLQWEMDQLPDSANVFDTFGNAGAEHGLPHSSPSVPARPTTPTRAGGSGGPLPSLEGQPRGSSAGGLPGIMSRARGRATTEPNLRRRVPPPPINTSQLLQVNISNSNATSPISPLLEQLSRRPPSFSGSGALPPALSQQDQGSLGLECWTAGLPHPVCWSRSDPGRSLAHSQSNTPVIPTNADSPEITREQGRPEDTPLQAQCFAISAETERLAAEVAGQMRELDGCQRDFEADIRRAVGLPQRPEAGALPSHSASLEANAQLASLLERLRELSGSREAANSDAASPSNAASPTSLPSAARPASMSAEVIDYEDCYAATRSGPRER